MNDLLPPAARCEAPGYICGWGVEDAGSYQNAKKLARAHFKKTGHATRAEQVRTHIFLPEE